MENQQKKGRSATAPKRPDGKTADAVATPPAPPPKESVAKCPLPPEMDQSEPLLKHLGGSQHDDWNQVVCNQVLNAAKYPKNATPEERAKQYFSHLALVGEPQDVIEGMMASQLFASHAAALECYRRAMLPDQSPEGRQMNLTQAAKLTRANAAQVEALAKHRNKGWQKITIEHVHVYQGGQAIVGSNVTPGGAGKIGEVQPHAITYAGSAPMRCENAQGHALPVASDAERALPDARRTVTGRA